MDTTTHELVMMAITGVVFLSIGYVAGRIIQRFVDINEFSEPSQPYQEYQEYQEYLFQDEQRAA